MYRVGTITDIDYNAHTATVELDEALSVAQDLDVNQSMILENIPVKYMDCDANAFVVDDRVVVEFTGQGWESPQVIGFETNPQPCEWHLAIIDAPMGEFSSITFPTGFNGTVVLVGAGGPVGETTGTLEDEEYDIQDSGGAGGAGGAGGYEIHQEVCLDEGSYRFRVGSYSDQTNGRGDTYLETVGIAYAGGQGGSVDRSTRTLTPGLKGQGNAGMGGGAVFMIAEVYVWVEEEEKTYDFLHEVRTSTGAEPGHVFWKCDDMIHAAAGAGGGPDGRMPEPMGIAPQGGFVFVWHPPSGLFLPDLLPEEQAELVNQHESIRYICSGSLGITAVAVSSESKSVPGPFGCRVSPCIDNDYGSCGDFKDKGYHGYGSGGGKEASGYDYTYAGQGVIILISPRKIEYEIE